MKNITKRFYDSILQSLAYLGYKVRLHPLRTAFYLTIFFSAAAFYFAFLNNLPNPYVLGFEQANASTKIYDRYGRVLYTISGGKDASIQRTFISLKDVPMQVKQATLAIEDQNFYSHKGVSLRGIMRAIKHDFFVRADKNNPIDLHGGSTITQQLVKNAMLTPEKTIKRKLQEIFLASAVEMIYTKDEIIEMYFNQVAYGGMAYGIEAAAEKYFGKRAQDLNLAEAALLAGLPQAPSRWSPHGAYPQTAKTRQTQVLNRMVEDGYITPFQAQEAKKEVLAFAPRTDQIKAPHFVLYVKDYLAQRFGQAVLEKGGLHVFTSLDLDIQEQAEQAVRDNVKPIEHRYNLHNGAALVTKPKTGEILAMVGSVDFWDLKNDGNVNLTTSLRQPGSSIKPITYSYALEHAGFTPSTILVDRPRTYCDEWKNCYTPVNYDSKFKGRITLKKALAESRNLTAVEVLNKIGVDKLVEQANKMGIKTWNTPEKYGLSLTLGAAEVRMLDMAVVFGTIANMGQKKELTPINKIVDSQGQIIQDIEKSPKLWAEIARKAYAADPNAVEGGEPAMSTFTSWQIIDILSDNYARAGEFGMNTPLRIKINDEDRKVFVKTGTSNDFKDNWTDGCSPDYCVLTWVGNNNGDPMYKVASGITGAAPIWNKIMTNVLQDTEPTEFPMPEGMIEVEVCAANGLLPCKGCPKTKKAWFVPGTEPTKKCYFPSPEECQAKKAQMEAEGKPAEEIVKALSNCPLEAPKPNP